MPGEEGRLGVSLFVTFAHKFTQVHYGRLVFYLFILVSGHGLTLRRTRDHNFIRIDTCLLPTKPWASLVCDLVDYGDTEAHLIPQHFTFQSRRDYPLYQIRLDP